MNRFLFSPTLVVLAGTMACHPANAQSYQDGFNAGKAAGFQEGWAAARKFTPPAINVGNQTQMWQNIGVSSGGTQQLPQYYIVVTEGLQNQAGPGLAGGALTFEGAQLDNPEIWNAILDRSANIAGIDRQKLQLYALPVDDLVSGSKNMKGFLVEAGTGGIAQQIDLGSSKDALAKFGSVPMFSDGNLVMVK